MPPGPGNPFVALQAQMATWRIQLTALQAQLWAVQNQLSTMQGQNSTLQSTLQNQIDALKKNMAAMGSAATVYEVYDGHAQPQKVGQIVGVDQLSLTPSVGLTVKDNATLKEYTFALKVFPERLEGGPLLFSAVGCDKGTGTPLIMPTSIDSSHPAYAMSVAALVDIVVDVKTGALDPVKKVLYVSEPGAKGQTMPVLSRLFPDGITCQTLNTSRFVVPATARVIDMPYITPYSVR
ncbi:MAG: hypothetical protein AUH29_10140 [Candidatus Rokubacteria bacterium 13_1_40CM_69_27]|nr:MAG: hypothetical protein AUH29_10140 [Candidatus Rokubacteria bacterium 13_1_40CM_69_27]OLC37906.1 MAG: hypothetical protein AUH81_05260 [Candidatus Rokubacteria bacterium 13_1_40CM_4_69_5]OLE38204.1 MAG: hypothetical protein AUG00_05975 [Candidatus Rokubacteria bacterium 13_1_20CM_2_70_7]